MSDPDWDFAKLDLGADDEVKRAEPACPRLCLAAYPGGGPAEAILYLEPDGRITDAAGFDLTNDPAAVGQALLAFARARAGRGPADVA